MYHHIHQLFVGDALDASRKNSDVSNSSPEVIAVVLYRFSCETFFRALAFWRYYWFCYQWDQSLADVDQRTVKDGASKSSNQLVSKNWIIDKMDTRVTMASTECASNRIGRVLFDFLVQCSTKIELRATERRRTCCWPLFSNVSFFVSGNKTDESVLLDVNIGEQSFWVPGFQIRKAKLRRHLFLKERLYKLP